MKESTAERTKLRRQKKSDEKNNLNEFNKIIVEKDKSVNKDLVLKNQKTLWISKFNSYAKAFV